MPFGPLHFQRKCLYLTGSSHLIFLEVESVVSIVT